MSNPIRPVRGNPRKYIRAGQRQSEFPQHPAPTTLVRPVGGGGASKSQPRATVAGRPIYLGERKPAIPTCRDEVTDALQVVAAGGRGRSFTVEEVCATMAATGTCWPRATVAKTMLRMTHPARRSLRLERVSAGHYRLATP